MYLVMTDSVPISPKGEVKEGVELNTHFHHIKDNYMHEVFK